MLLLAWSFSSVKCTQPATFLVQVAPLSFYLQVNCFVLSSVISLCDYMICLPEQSSLYRFSSRGGTSSMCNLRAWAPVPHQWQWVPRRLARTQRWHHQLRQLPVCHADGVSVHHHGGLDRRAVLGELPPRPHSLLPSPASSDNNEMGTRIRHQNDVTAVRMKLLMVSWGSCCHTDMIDWLNNNTMLASHLQLLCDCSSRK